MRLRLKIVYLFRSTFLRLKNRRKWVFQNGGLSFASDKEVIF